MSIIREGWAMVAKELKLYNKCTTTQIKEMRLMFMTGAMYAATHRKELDEIFDEGMKEFNLFDSNNGGKDV